MLNKKQKIPIFVVNLKNDIEKKEHMQELCQKYNLQIEFIEAVDGRALNKKDINEVYSSIEAIDVSGRELSRGEIGCALSHKIIYEKILYDNIELSLILEDDIDFNEDLLTILDMKNEFQENWELVLLGHHTGYSRDVDTLASIWSQVQLTEKYRTVRPCEKGYGTYGYLITHIGAKKLLDHLDVITKPIDHYTGDSKYINLYTINPAPIKIHEQLSKEHSSMKDRKFIKYTQNKLFSFRDLISKFIRKYHFLVSIKNSMKRIMLRIKPLRNYK